jgi:hypothetical protein
VRGVAPVVDEQKTAVPKRREPTHRQPCAIAVVGVADHGWRHLIGEDGRQRRQLMAACSSGIQQTAGYRLTRERTTARQLMNPSRALN